MLKDRIPVGKKTVKNNHLANDRPDPHAYKWFHRQAYPCKTSAEMIRKQGTQIGSMTAKSVPYTDEKGESYKECVEDDKIRRIEHESVAAYLADKYDITTEYMPGGDRDGQECNL